MPLISMVARGTLIAALIALGLAIGIVAEQERLATAALGIAPVKLRLALGLLLAAFVAVCGLLFAVARAKPGAAPPPIQEETPILDAAAPEPPPAAEIRPSAALMPSTEAGQLMAAGALTRRLFHELNNALGPIQGFADLLSNDAGVGEPQRRQAAKIADATAAALRTIRSFAAALGWANDRAAVVHLGAVIRAAGAAGQSALGQPIAVSLKSETDVQVTATEAEVGQALLHLCAAIAPLLSERAMQMEVVVDSVVGAAMTSSDNSGGTGPRLEIWSDPFEPERMKVQFGALQSSSRYGRMQFSGIGHGWTGALASSLFAAEAPDQTSLSMAVLGGLMVDLGGVVMIDTCPQKHLSVTLLWPARISSEVAAPLEIDTTEDDLDALIIHEIEPAAEALSRRLGALGLRVASTTSPETGLDLIAEMGARCRAILIGETSDAGLRMKVAAIRPGAPILMLRAQGTSQATDPDSWQIDPDSQALDLLAARLRRAKSRGAAS